MKLAHLKHAIHGIGFAAWIRMHRMPRPLLNYWQYLELRNIVNEAYYHVPMYKKFYNDHGICPEDIKSLDDLRALPVLDKHHIRSCPVSVVVHESLPPQNYIWIETSGSSGAPFRFPSSLSNKFLKKFGRHYSAVVSARFLLDRGISPRNTYKNIRFAEIRMPYRPRGSNFLHITLSDLRIDPRAALQRLRFFRPDVISSRPTPLAELARVNNTMPPNERLQFSYADSGGEMLTEAQRHYIGESFGCEVYNRYGTEETGCVAGECQEHNGLHIYEESSIIEILDEHDEPVGDGEEGRVVITNFHNLVLPFIRYDTGDRGAILLDACPCGLGTRRISVLGRMGSLLTIRGQRYDGIELGALLGRFSPILLRYQFAKVSEDSVELRIIPAPAYSAEEALRLRQVFRDTLGIEPEVKVVHDIPYTDGGKTRFIVDETTG